MRESTLKIVIPMAGLGTRLRPHTWSKPKQLVSVAGKTVLDHVLDTFSTIPDSIDIELVNIVGYLGEQIEEYIEENYPHIPSKYVVQENPRGQSHAIQLAGEYLRGPMLIVFADTLIETDLSFLETEEAGSVAWVKPVPDPRRFGVAEVNQDGWVTRLIEKPDDTSNDLAVVGFYYFKQAEDLLEAIEEQMRQDIQTKGEYYLVDAINIMLDQGLKMRTEKVDIWLDAGTPEALLETNRYLLENGMDNSREIPERPGVLVRPPVNIHPSAHIENAIIGPYVSLGANAQVENSILKDLIFEDQAKVSGLVLENSLVGRSSVLRKQPFEINVGDNTELLL
jgi:glucose-1-phosphate thymidylyltransferase